jgi:hypothetical protein
LWSDLECFIIVYYYSNYSYHLVNAKSLALSQSDHIKQASSTVAILIEIPHKNLHLVIVEKI